MNQNESWIAEQARLLTLEDGFGPASAPTRSGSADADEDSSAQAAAA